MSERSYSEVQSVARAAQILLAFAEAEEWGPTELARKTGLHKSVVHRLLQTMARSGLLACEERGGRYSLGPIMAHLNPRDGAYGTLVRIARPYMKRLAEATGETISLCVVEGSLGLCIDVIDSRQSMRFTVHKGETFPLNAGCIGKVLLAFQPDDFIDGLIQQRALKRYTENTITDPRRLRAELRQVRRVGHAFSDAEITPGARSIGAPVFGADGRVAASLVVSAPSFRLPDSKVRKLTEMICREATRLSAELGYMPKALSAGR
ncbi:MAG: IclR family transcriptional regulator [Alphaproteobacteria bacterium]|nr:IclR family transcriptional regulator [Alphaproteobacteria bacterium]